MDTNNIKKALLQAEKLGNNLSDEELGEKLAKIAVEHKLGREEAKAFALSFLDQRKRQTPNAELFAKLRSGYRIDIGESVESTMDHLLNAIVGESVVRWKDGDFDLLYEGFLEEVKYVVQHFDEQQKSAILVHLLMKEVHEKFEEIYKHIFPSKYIRDTEKQQAPFPEMKKNVNEILLLGSYSEEGIHNLHEIQKALLEKGEKAVIVMDQSDIEGEGLINKVAMHAMVSKFVIVENSHPSGHLYELPHVIKANPILVILQRESAKSTTILKDLVEKSEFAELFLYEEDTLSKVLDEVIEWANQKAAEDSD